MRSGRISSRQKPPKQAIKIALAAQLVSSMLDALGVWAALLAKESAGQLAERAKKSRALSILSLVLHHPATWQLRKDRAASLQTELVAALSPEIVAAAQARSRSRDLWATAKEMLVELGG